MSSNESLPSSWTLAVGSSPPPSAARLTSIFFVRSRMAVPLSRPSSPRGPRWDSRYSPWSARRTFTTASTEALAAARGFWAAFVTARISRDCRSSSFNVGSFCRTRMPSWISTGPSCGPSTLPGDRPPPLPGGGGGGDGGRGPGRDSPAGGGGGEPWGPPGEACGGRGEPGGGAGEPGGFGPWSPATGGPPLPGLRAELLNSGANSQALNATSRRTRPIHTRRDARDAGGAPALAGFISVSSAVPAGGGVPSVCIASKDTLARRNLLQGRRIRSRR